MPAGWPIVRWSRETSADLPHSITTRFGGSRDVLDVGRRWPGKVPAGALRSLVVDAARGVDRDRPVTGGVLDGDGVRGVGLAEGGEGDEVVCGNSHAVWQARILREGAAGDDVGGGRRGEGDGVLDARLLGPLLSLAEVGGHLDDAVLY